MQIKKSGTQWIVTPSGYFNSDAGEAVKKIFDDFMLDDSLHFVLNFSEVNLINSLGLSYLTEILEVLEESDRKLAFCSCSPIIDKTLKLMGMDQYASIHPDCSELTEL
ncbi:MAG: STAS domain-containing protein [Calditrichaeota bacterium]|nr:STAS domain-containing protein [Calditrichota bacterium]